MRILVKLVGIFIVKHIAHLVYPPENLRGRWFERSTKGWRWVMQAILWQKIFGFNKHCSWPVSPFIKIGTAENIIFDIDDLNNFQTFGCYYQCYLGKIYIGKGTYIAPNVGIITSNHNPNNIEENLSGQDVHIGEACWIGMNSVILPGVVLGPHTIVGAGSVVTKSFLQGKCIIAGAPARLIRTMENCEGEDK